jgi:TolA-binding protein
MNSFLLVLLGVVLGMAIGWLLAAARSHAELVKSQVDAEGRVKAAEGMLQEVRARVSTLQTTLDGREREMGGLQQKIHEESEQKVKAQTELIA